MIVGIDASNIRGGGGLTHLSELLAAAEPKAHGIDQVAIWAPSSTLQTIQNRSWISKHVHPWLERSLPWRLAWQRIHFPSLLSKANCDVVFVPGGIFAPCPIPSIAMSQNLLPFDWKEIKRFGMTPFLFKLLMIRWAQKVAFKRADGVIFLTDYAKRVVVEAINWVPGRSAVIPHGVDWRFRLPPRTQRNIDECTHQTPFSLLYVSHIWPYKHPWAVARAVAYLRSEGVPIRLDIVGGGYGPSIRQLQKVIRELDPHREFLSYSGNVSHDQIAIQYRSADAFVFASSCETFGQIVTEAMSAGLPIICSDRAAMPELLGSAGEYFDPERQESLIAALRKVVASPELRNKMAELGYRRALKYSWKHCAADTFSFIAQVVAGSGKIKREK